MKLARLAGFQALKKSAWYVYADPEARLSPVLPLRLVADVVLEERAPAPGSCSGRSRCTV